MINQTHQKIYESLNIISSQIAKHIINQNNKNDKNDKEELINTDKLGFDKNYKPNEKTDSKKKEKTNSIDDNSNKSADKYIKNIRLYSPRKHHHHRPSRRAKSTFTVKLTNKMSRDHQKFKSIKHIRFNSDLFDKNQFEVETLPIIEVKNDANISNFNDNFQRKTSATFNLTQTKPANENINNVNEKSELKKDGNLENYTSNNIGKNNQLMFDYYLNSKNKKKKNNFFEKQLIRQKIKEKNIQKKRIMLEKKKLSQLCNPKLDTNSLKIIKKKNYIPLPKRAIDIENYKNYKIFINERNQNNSELTINNSNNNAKKNIKEIADFFCAQMNWKEKVIKKVEDKKQMLLSKSKQEYSEIINYKFQVNPHSEILLSKNNIKNDEKYNNYFSLFKNYSRNNSNNKKYDSYTRLYKEHEIRAKNLKKLTRKLTPNFQPVVNKNSPLIKKDYFFNQIPSILNKDYNQNKEMNQKNSNDNINKKILNNSNIKQKSCIQIFPKSRNYKVIFNKKKFKSSLKNMSSTSVSSNNYFIKRDSNNKNMNDTLNSNTKFLEIKPNLTNNIVEKKMIFHKNQNLQRNSFLNESNNLPTIKRKRTKRVSYLVNDSFIQKSNKEILKIDQSKPIKGVLKKKRSDYLDDNQEINQDENINKSNSKNSSYIDNESGFGVQLLKRKRTIQKSSRVIDKKNNDNNISITKKNNMKKSIINNSRIICFNGDESSDSKDDSSNLSSNNSLTENSELNVKKDHSIKKKLESEDNSNLQLDENSKQKVLEIEDSSDAAIEENEEEIKKNWIDKLNIIGKNDKINKVKQKNNLDKLYMLNLRNNSSNGNPFTFTANEGIFLKFFSKKK